MRSRGTGINAEVFSFHWISLLSLCIVFGFRRKNSGRKNLISKARLVFWKTVLCLVFVISFCLSIRLLVFLCIVLIFTASSEDVKLSESQLDTRGLKY